MLVVAEGVETEGVYQQLVTLGCDAVQGFHIRRPGNAAEISGWIDRQAAVG
jgi:diguanylate cyclase